MKFGYIGAAVAGMIFAAAPAFAQAPADDAAALATAMTAGEAGYRQNCMGCHGANGEGGIGFRLDGNPVTQTQSGVVNMIILGYPEHGMPPFGRLDDETIAAIATYVRNSWSNSYGLVTPAIVAQIRGAAAGE